MRASPEMDVSVVIPFADDEDRVAGLARRIAAHLRELVVRFEILAVDEDSGDNSVAVLSLLRTELPELRVLSAPGRGHGFAAGAREARGRTLWLMDVTHGDASLSAFGWAYARLAGGTDVVVVERRYVLCRRTRAWRVLDSMRGRGEVFERRFMRRAIARRLRVEVPPRPGAGARHTPLRRVIETLSSARFVGFLRSRA